MYVGKDVDTMRRNGRKTSRVKALLEYVSDMRGSITLRGRKTTCRIDTDCPPGYICIDGMCLPATHMRPR
jgi:hypothetical protein